MPISDDHSVIIMERYKLYQALSDKIVDIIESVLAGESEREACARNDISQSQFRRLMNAHWDTDVSKRINVSTAQTYDWQEAFLKDIFNKPVYPQPDFEAAFENALLSLSEKQQYIVTRYYKYCLSYDEIGKDLDVCRERVRQILAKAMRILRTPRIANAFLYGLDVQLETTIAEEQLKQAQAALQEKRNTLAILTAKIEEYDHLLASCQISKPLPSHLQAGSIHTLKMSKRTTQALLRAGVYTISQLQSLSPSDLWNIPSLGVKCINEISETLRRLNQLQMPAQTSDPGVPVVLGA